MASKVVGLASGYTLDGLTITVAGITGVVIEPQSLSLKIQESKAELKNAAGDIIARGSSGRNHVLDCRAIFTATTGTRQQLLALLLDPGSLILVTIAGMGAGSPTLFNGTWNLEELSWEFSNDIFAIANMSMSRSGTGTPAALPAIS